VPNPAIPDTAIPRALNPLLQHVLDTYASETNKVASVWREFRDGDLEFRPHEKSATVIGIFKHELLSQRRFFGEFLGLTEPAAGDVLPSEPTVEAFTARLVAHAQPRLGQLAVKSDSWWMEEVPFFDVTRQRVWIFWRRVLHTAHHRTQLTLYLRMMGRPVPSSYGPTADVTWTGADPTATIDAAGRR
jgi:uncharacterized damage-inducible protein DinB